MFSPLLKKAEEKAGLKKEESPDSKSGTPPQKRLCTVYAKQLAKFPAGDQGLVKDGELSLPGDGLPAVDDWLQTFESMLFGTWTLETGSVEIIKGWTRATCVATILAAAAEVDLQDPAGIELLKPIYHILDKCWLVALDVGEVAMSYRNLQLSYQGSERQAPNNLQLALRFSRVIEVHHLDGTHPAHWSAEERLRDVVSKFHVSAGLTARHRIDDDKFRSLLNLIQGSCPEARQVLSAHLDRHKWKESAFSTEQFRSTRWVLGTSPKIPACPMKKALTVGAESQALHLQLVVKSYSEACRKLRPSARSKMRLSQEQFDRFCDFSCVYTAVLQEARQLSSFTAEKEAEVRKSYFQKKHGFLDYFAEIEAAISSKLQTWQLQHLSLWTDLIEPPKVSVVIQDSDDIVAMEDAAQAAKFREVKAKIAQDCAAMGRFNAASAASAKRLHVVGVLHEKGQIQVAVEDVQTLVYCDCTKMGVMSQPEINAMGEFLEKVLFRSPFRSAAVVLPPLLFGSTAGGSLRADWRKIEDKLVNNCRIEIRNFVVNLDMGEVHKNREFPGAYLCWLCVADSTLPNKGTAHRALRGKDAEPAPAQEIFHQPFRNEILWCQGSSYFLMMAAETSQTYRKLPSGWVGSQLQNRSWWHFLETWILSYLFVGGQEEPPEFDNFYEMIFDIYPGDDPKKIKPTVLIHPTAYDSAVELAGLQLGLASVSCSVNHVYFKSANEILKNHLVQAWKDNKSPMEKYLPRSKKELPAEEVPAATSRPELSICQIVDGKMILPRDIRQQFLTCPVWGTEWRALLQQFDREWGCHETTAEPVSESAPTVDVGPSYMPNEPDTLAKLKEKYGDPLAELPVPDSPTVLLLMTGPVLFIMAKEAVTMRPFDGPVILHGARTWLTGDKAAKFEADQPGRGIPCRFEDDYHKENGSDSAVMVLRHALQQVEKNITVDFTLGGHKCERPPQVTQGNADDFFQVSPDPDSQLLWRPTAVAMRNLKYNNVASHFLWTKLKDSPLELAPHLLDCF
eukprot:s2934_g7.t1